ncbi:hypothetical protein [Pseudomaricurvus hydrocarbonicus]
MSVMNRQGSLAAPTTTGGIPLSGLKADKQGLIIERVERFYRKSFPEQGKKISIHKAAVSRLGLLFWRTQN